MSGQTLRLFYCCQWVTWIYMYCIILYLSHSIFSKDVFWEQKIWNDANSYIHVCTCILISVLYKIVIRWQLSVDWTFLHVWHHLTHLQNLPQVGCHSSVQTSNIYMTNLDDITCLTNTCHDLFIYYIGELNDWYFIKKKPILHSAGHAFWGE